jgi:hypothetical protein
MAGRGGDGMTLEELTDAQLWEAHAGGWKWWGGAYGKFPTADEMHAEMKRRDGWVTMCSTCGEWFSIKTEDEHECAGYWVPDFQDA